MKNYPYQFLLAPERNTMAGWECCIALIIQDDFRQSFFTIFILVVGFIAII
jgi:hypothetical protein